MTNSIGEIENAGCLLVIGSNTTANHPVIGYRVRRAKKRGAGLIVVDPRRIELAEDADIFLQLKPGTNVALLNSIMNVILDEGLADQKFIDERTEGFEELKQLLAAYTPEKMEDVTGVSADLVRQAARLYARAESASILYTMGITQHTSGTDNVLSVANLAMMTGNVGRPSTGVNPLRGQNNVQGACDMGALPNVYTGYQKVGDSAVQKKFSSAWGVKLNDKPGLTVSEIFAAADKGDVKALYIMGENPVLSDPNASHVVDALKKLDFLVVQDIFLTETAKYADVVLPATTFAEKEGTFTNTERRVQRVRRAVSPRGESRPDWEIITDLASRLGFDWNYASPASIMEEIASLTPSYGGISYQRLEKEGLQWPCPSADHPGTLFLHSGKFSRGKGLFTAVEFKPADELPDQAYPFLLTTGRNHFHYHTGTMTRRSCLKEHVDEELMQINPEDAQRLGIKDGDVVKVRSRRGEVSPRVVLTDTVPTGVVFMTFHFRETAVNLLTNPALDAKAKIPELKVCAVQVEKA